MAGGSVVEEFFDADGGFVGCVELYWDHSGFGQFGCVDSDSAGAQGAAEFGVGEERFAHGECFWASGERTMALRKELPGNALG